MDLLVLGGTGFLGTHVVEASLARGHAVSVLHRGLHGAGRHGERAEQLRGDRDAPGDLDALRGRAWDAVIDSSGRTRRHLEATAGVDAGHYVFVSSVSAYPGWPADPVDETSPVSTDDEDPEYGPQKAAAERALLRARGEAGVAIVRAGLIVGPGDDVFRLPWWLERLARGGDVPAPGPPERELQLIDARDLATWLLDLAEGRVGGTFNATGPVGQTTLGEVLDAGVAATAAGARLRWIADDALVALGVEPWTELPLWLPADDFPGAWRVATDRAQAAGLRCRPIAQTVSDTVGRLARDGGREALDDLRADLRPAPLSPEREAELLAATR